MNGVKTGITLLLLLIAIVLLAGCTGLLGHTADLQYRIGPGTSLVYETQTAVSGQNTTPDILITDMKVNQRVGDTITWDAVLRTQPGNVTVQDIPIQFSTNSREIPEKIPSEKQIVLNLMALPGTLVYPENPVRPGETWTYSPAFNGTMNSSGIPVGYRYTAQDTYTYLGNGAVTVAAGTFDCKHILHTGTSHLTFTMPVENKTIITNLDGTYTGDHWVRADLGTLVKSDYEKDTMTIIDTSSMMGNPLGLSMMGSSSHTHTITELVR